MIEIASLVVAGLSALSALIQAYNSAKVLNKKIATKKIKQANERASKPLKVGGKRVSEVIDEELLNAFLVEIQSQHQILLKAIHSDSMSVLEKDKVIAESSS